MVDMISILAPPRRMRSIVSELSSILISTNGTANATKTVRTIDSKSIGISSDSVDDPMRAVSCKFYGLKRTIGIFGHLGEYKKEIEITRIIEYSGEPVQKHLAELRQK